MRLEWSSEWFGKQVALAVATDHDVPRTESVGQYIKVILEHYHDEKSASQKW